MILPRTRDVVVEFVLVVIAARQMVPVLIGVLPKIGVAPLLKADSIHEGKRKSDIITFLSN